VYIFMKRKLKEKKIQLVSRQLKYFRGICKQNDIQLKKRRSLRLQGVSINCTKFSQSVSTFIPSSQSMTKWDYPWKRRKLPNERKQSYMGMKIILFSMNNKIQSCPRVRFHDDRHVTKISRQPKTLLNSWKFNQQISSFATRSRKNPSIS